MIKRFLQLYQNRSRRQKIENKKTKIILRPRSINNSLHKQKFKHLSSTDKPKLYEISHLIAIPHSSLENHMSISYIRSNREFGGLEKCQH